MCELFVSVNGEDDHTCGSQDQPCRTLPWATMSGQVGLSGTALKPTKVTVVLSAGLHSLLHNQTFGGKLESLQLVVRPGLGM